MHSTSYSNESSNSSHLNGKWLQRSLEFKVRKLRTLLTADEDISTELDRVVCRLMKLALTTHRNKNTPPPTSWLQCKLLDLLTLTERAIQRRKKYYFNKNLSITIGDYQNNRNRELEPPKNNDSETAKEIMAKYNHFAEEPDERDYYNNTTVGSYRYVHLEVENDDISVTSNEFVKVYDYKNQECSSSPSSVEYENNKFNSIERDTSPTRMYVAENYSGISSSGDTDHSFKVNNRSKCERINRKCKRETNKDKHKIKVLIKKSKKTNGKEAELNEKRGRNTDKRVFFKKTIKKKSFCRCIFKNSVSSAQCERNKLVKKRKIRQHHRVCSLSKPIPYSLVNLCTPNDDNNTKKHVDELIPMVCNNSEHILARSQESMAITEQSCVIEIVTDKISETLTLHRTITTDANESLFKNNSLPVEFKDKVNIVPLVKSESSVTEFALKTENEESQAIFLYDINEPSTSKGIRHVTMDVQCGPDTGFVCPYSSATSLSKISNDNTNVTELKSYANECEQCYFHTTPEEYNNNAKSNDILSSRFISNGIQIKDSGNEIHRQLEISTMTQSIDNFENINDLPKNILKGSTNVVSSLCKIYDKVSNVMELDNSTNQHPHIQQNISDFKIDENDRSKRPSKHLDPIIDLPKVINSTKTEHLSKEIDLKNNIPICNIGKGKLTYGGIFIHSYKERTACEDILYQGKWQRSLSKTFTKKNSVNAFTLKKIKMSENNTRKRRNSRESLSAKTMEKTSDQNECRKKVRKTIDVQRLKKHNNISNNDVILAKRKRSVDLYKPTRHRKTLKKVASKTVSFDLSKNTRFERVTVKRCKSKIYQNSIKEKKKVVTFKESHSKCEFNTRNTLLNAVNYSADKDKLDFPKTLTKTMNIRKELMKFVCEPHDKVVYSVFRNKIENETDSQRHSKPAIEIRRNKEHKTSRNIQPANSSSSSTNSIATIRQLSPPSHTKKKFPSKIALKVSNIPRTSSVKEKVSAPECNKMTSIMFDDKENNPQSSNFTNIQCNKENKQNVNGRSKTILISRNTSPKQKKTSNISIKKSIENIEAKLGSLDSLTSRKVSLAEPIKNVITKNQNNFNTKSSDLVLVLESYKQLPLMENEKLCPDICSSEDRQEIIPLANIFELTCEKNEKVVSKNVPDETVYHEMMIVVEEILNFTEDHTEKNFFLNKENKQISSSEHKKSGEKVHFNKTLENESTETSLDSGPKQVNVDLISFKSFASLSGYSEYFLADSELSATTDSLQIMTSSKRSVQDIFERNYLSFPGDSVQGFSGFSINEQAIGDQPAYNNLINPETGSITHGMEARRATSEEVFTSGRSSDTYVSCQVDEDTLVPHWLFHAISQQQSDEDRDPQRILTPIPLPTVEPDLELHSNVVEPGVGGAAGAGAGDGRGIHSDQDSSGRDTSMSSTETSSGQQSDAILIDPSAYANNIEFLREPSSRPFLQLGSTESPGSSFRTVEGSENDNMFNMSEVSTRNNLNLGVVQSDRDADVSSLDTDTADFSDN